jgi:phenylalanyl-tRNA synthetase beta chain
MIITKQWLLDWVELENVSTEKLCKTLNEIGLEVDSVVKHTPPKGVVIGKVLQCQKHPDADKLNVCEVDIGNERLQIVCGAKNVAASQYVAVSKVGSTLPGGLTIKEAELRGVKSSGMICSLSELGYPPSNDGILELDDSMGVLNIGSELSTIECFSDSVIEIGLTANRGDCLSIYGVSRDLSAAFGADFKVVAEEIDEENKPGIGRVLQLNAKDKCDANLLYKVLETKTVKSSALIDFRLALVQKYSDNVLDRLLSYATYDTGIILRAYDFDFFKSDESERVAISFMQDKNGVDLVVDTSGKVASAVGITQYKDSCVKSQNDNRVIIEASYINPDLLLEKASKSELSKDDKYYYSSRGSDPDLTLGLSRFIGALLGTKSEVELFAGVQSSIKDEEILTVNIDLHKISQIIGQDIATKQAIDILKALNFEVNIGVKKDIVAIRVPKYRHDIKNEQDIAEEIVRIIGIDNIQSQPLSVSEAYRLSSGYANFKKRKKIRQNGVGAGFFEIVSYVFGSNKLQQKYGFDTLSEKKELTNPITSELDTLRSTLSLNMIEAAVRNHKFGKKVIKLFEIGKVFDKNRKESTKVGFLSSGFVAKANIENEGKPKQSDFFSFARSISNVIGAFSIEPVEKAHPLFDPYQYGQLIQHGKKIGYIAKLHIQAQKEFDLEDSYFCEVDFDKIFDDDIVVKEYSKYPSLTRDISVLVPKDLDFIKIKKFLANKLSKDIVDFYPIDIYQDKSLGDKQSLTIRFVIQSMSKTLNDQEISAIMDAVLEKLENKMDIHIR